ncbi:hypothetical protein [Paenibacillus monticola]|uniref:TIGR03986 family CRISPR-associated RAMP protein n=1 Tax=Paenibacillus monticola TaxID=2666075 RepID=A0A7X2H421_9BACL|nr:hypothetical protein [Paenibacillus monticola]MRN53119.1 hypothetical protein [Paenibacillus monticola]
MNKANRSAPHPVTLPYDFVPFAGDEVKPAAATEYPYLKSEVPSHDGNAEFPLSGYLSYRITPHSDLALEVRKRAGADAGGNYFISGSQIRGRIRANVEMLSASYPEFIDRSEMLYRELMKPAGEAISSNAYKDLLGIGSTQGNKKIEQVVRAGFLEKVGNEYYIIPAKPFGDNNFVSIKEFELVTKGLLDRDNHLFQWGINYRNGKADSNLIQKLSKPYREIEELDKDISGIRRSSLKGEITKEVEEIIKRIFTNDFAFNTHIKGYNPDLVVLQEQLISALQDKVGNEKLEPLFTKMSERWRLKAEIHLMYKNKVVPVNPNFKPFQKNVNFIASGTYISSLSISPIKEGGQKGFLYNSTNASSKRSHYLIGEADKQQEKIPVPPAVIETYKLLYNKMRSTSKSFYNVFDEYTELFKACGREMPIVFYQDNVNHEKVPLRIGRTPYFKVPFGHQLKGLLGDPAEQLLDYAQALFGYISVKGEEGYKSRLRFSPVDLKGEADFEGDKKPFLLMSPYASAGGMYLRPKKGVPQGYTTAKGSMPNPSQQLNGYKYYHILKDTVPYHPSGERKNMETVKTVFSKQNINNMDGKIYFSNLSQQELGLVLLSLDIELLLESQKYRGDVQKYLNHSQSIVKMNKRADGTLKPETLYELIGGAKPYGYGKVQFKIKDLCLEKQGNDFESLIVNTSDELQSNYTEYIDAFIEAMNGPDLFNRIHLDRYIRSKQEIDFAGKENHCNWDNLEYKISTSDREGGKKGGGYPANWVLER